jgi:hypothetical protein
MKRINYKSSIFNLLPRITLIVLIFTISQSNLVADNTREANDSCKYALSHFTAAVPYGTITDAWNSENWDMEFPVTDPKTGISGIKVDDIENFGENGSGSFKLNYTVCLSDTNQLNLLLNQNFEVAYKAGTCVFYEDISPDVLPLEATLVKNDVNCSDPKSGSIYTTVNGGQSPYIYSWSNGATTPNLTNIEAGTYTVIISDSGNDSISLSAIIEAPMSLNVQGTVTPASCANSNGAIDLEVSGGNPPYSFNWNSGDTAEDINNIPSGVYTVIVTDSNECQTQTSFYVSETSPINIRATTNKPACYETNAGIITLEVSNGTPPYSYEWSTGDTTQNLSELESGQYTVTVTDAEGCTKTKNVSISNELFYASISTTDADCLGNPGSSTLKPNNGTPPYEVLWSTGDTTLVVEDLESGYHTVRITDANGCSLFQSVTIQGGQGPDINTSTQWTGCTSDDSIRVIVSTLGNSGPYEWRIDGTLTPDTFYIYEDGEYKISVTDANGCSTTETTVISAKPAGPEIQLNVTDADCANAQGSASIDIYGEGPFTIKWNGTEGTSHNNTLTAGIHEVSVTDANGCISSKTFAITEIIHPEAEIMAPAEMPECESESNLLESITNNVQNFNWQLISTNEDWIITTEQANSLIYNAGNGSALAVFSTESLHGCTSADSLWLECTEQITPPDTTNNDNNNPEKECGAECYTIINSPVTSTTSGCYNYEITITTDQTCWYDLSHLII